MGYILGLPTLERTLVKAKELGEKLYGDKDPYVFQPQTHEVPTNVHVYQNVPPAWMFVGYFSGEPTPADKNAMGATLTVVWFSDVATPIFDDVIPEVQAIWDEHAKNYNDL